MTFILPQQVLRSFVPQLSPSPELAPDFYPKFISLLFPTSPAKKEFGDFLIKKGHDIPRSTYPQKS